MGIYDKVVTEVALPTRFIGELKAKSSITLTTVLIRADERLLIKDREFKICPPKELASKEVSKRCSICTLRVINENWRDLNFRGYFEFYGYDAETQNYTAT